MAGKATCSCACGAEVTESERLQRLDGVLEEYRGRPGALIPVLQTAQGLFGYLPREAIKRISLGLGLAYGEVAGVVSFYSFFSTVPRGEHLVRVCLGTACYVRGGKKVLESVKKSLGIDVGQTTPDRKFSLEVARCFGACGLAPVLTVDEDIHQRVKAARVQELLDGYRNGGAAPKAKAAAAKPKAAAKAKARAKAPAKARAKAKKGAKR